MKALKCDVCGSLHKFGKQNGYAKIGEYTDEISIRFKQYKIIVLCPECLKKVKQVLRINDESEKEYFYGMRLRGFSIGAQPTKGFIRREENFIDNRYYDILVYNRKLTEKELADYELDYLWGDSDE